MDAYSFMESPTGAKCDMGCFFGRAWTAWISSLQHRTLSVSARRPQSAWRVLNYICAFMLPRGWDPNVAGLLTRSHTLSESCLASVPCVACVSTWGVVEQLKRVA